jgi:succinyl-diaminopimelate desuccinylase
VRLLDRLASRELDRGTAHFGPSTLAITTVDVGNPASNVIPAEARATLNIRFNDAHTPESLTDWIEEEADRVAEAFGVGIAARFQVSGTSFLTEPGRFTDLVAGAVAAATGVTPELSTTGGTSDARFVKDHCPVVEFGLVGATMHQVDEHVELAHIRELKTVYAGILARYFADPPGRE